MTTEKRGLKACLINCSLEKDRTASHTMRLLERIAHVMSEAGAEVDVIHAREHAIAFGMTTDASSGDVVDEWPTIHRRVMAADILVLGSPIWLGAKSSVATLIVERLYAHSAETNDAGQYLYYGKVGGCAVTGNEDGAKAVAMETLYALQHIGFTIPPQADCGWLGEIGPGPSYGDAVEGSDTPAGYDSEFTNRNATTMAWNLMHMADLLRRNDGLPAIGNTEAWTDVPNAADAMPGRP